MWGDEARSWLCGGLHRLSYTVAASASLQECRGGEPSVHWSPVLWERTLKRDLRLLDPKVPFYHTKRYLQWEYDWTQQSWTWAREDTARDLSFGDWFRLVHWNIVQERQQDHQRVKRRFTWRRGGEEECQSKRKPSSSPSKSSWDAGAKECPEGGKDSRTCLWWQGWRRCRPCEWDKERERTELGQVSLLEWAIRKVW